MTMIVKVEGYPDRLACEDCGCEIAAQREGEPWRPVDSLEYEYVWLHELEVDEPPLRLDIHDGCHCHESYLHMLCNNYDREGR